MVHSTIQLEKVKFTICDFRLVFSMIGTLFPLPRILYSMASDGLLFEIFSKVDSNKKTPFWGTLLCGIFTGKCGEQEDILFARNYYVCSCTWPLGIAGQVATRTFCFWVKCWNTISRRFVGTSTTIDTRTRLIRKFRFFSKILTFRG